MIEINSIDNISKCLIKTAKIKTYLNILKIYLENEIPFNIIGLSGTGIRYISQNRNSNFECKNNIFSFLFDKRLLLQNAINDLPGYDLITIKCSSQLTASYVLYILKQV